MSVLCDDHAGSATTPVTIRRGAALIVSHGSPSTPLEGELRVRALANAVAARLPHWRVLGATLGGVGTVTAAWEELLRWRVATSRTDGAIPPAVVYPMFMSDGWFVSEELPRRITRLVQGDDFTLAQPFGLSAGAYALSRDVLVAGAESRGWAPHRTVAVIAAHGARRDPRPAFSALALARWLTAQSVFRAVVAGFLEQSPLLSDVAQLPDRALCLPYFASDGGHVRVDVPRALRVAGFGGALLEAIGRNPKAAAVIAAALSRPEPPLKLGRAPASEPESASASALEPLALEREWEPPASG